MNQNTLPGVHSLLKLYRSELYSFIMLCAGWKGPWWRHRQSDAAASRLRTGNETNLIPTWFRGFLKSTRLAIWWGGGRGLRFARRGCSKKISSSYDPATCSGMKVLHVKFKRKDRETQASLAFKQRCSECHLKFFNVRLSKRILNSVIYF